MSFSERHAVRELAARLDPPQEKRVAEIGIDCLVQQRDLQRAGEQRRHAWCGEHEAEEVTRSERATACAAMMTVEGATDGEVFETFLACC